jgi:hypothetical protein
MQQPSKVHSTMNVDFAAAPIELAEEDAVAENSERHSGIGGTAIAVTAVGLGAVAFEAALLPGVVLGVAAMWLPHDARQAFAPHCVYGCKKQSLGGHGSCPKLKIPAALICHER